MKKKVLLLILAISVFGTPAMAAQPGGNEKKPGSTPPRAIRVYRAKPSIPAQPPASSYKRTYPYGTGTPYGISPRTFSSPYPSNYPPNPFNTYSPGGLIVNPFMPNANTVNPFAPNVTPSNPFMPTTSTVNPFVSTSPSVNPFAVNIATVNPFAPSLTTVNPFASTALKNLYDAVSALNASATTVPRFNFNQKPSTQGTTSPSRNLLNPYSTTSPLDSMINSLQSGGLPAQ